MLAHDLVHLRARLVGGFENKDGVALLHHVGCHLPTSGLQPLGQRRLFYGNRSCCIASPRGMPPADLRSPVIWEKTIIVRKKVLV